MGSLSQDYGNVLPVISITITVTRRGSSQIDGELVGHLVLPGFVGILVLLMMVFTCQCYIKFCFRLLQL